MGNFCPPGSGAGLVMHSIGLAVHHKSFQITDKSAHRFDF
jgi:hypothetical protein